MTEADELPPGVLANEVADDLFTRAASGDHDAQAAMSANVLAMGEAGLVPIWESLLVAEMYARLAATSGQPKRIAELAHVLTKRLIAGDAGPIGDAGPHVRLTLEMEIITLLDQAADEGDADAAWSLTYAADCFSSEAVMIARQVRADLKALADGQGEG